MNYGVIKENDLFYVFGPEGMIGRQYQHGLFTRDTRFLSRLQWHVQPDVLVLLESDTSTGYESVYRYTNRPPEDESGIPRESLLITRRQWVDGQALHESLIIENFAMVPVSLKYTYIIDADFLDMFEVRGFRQTPLARQIDVHSGNGSCVFSYMAQDGLITRTTVLLKSGEATVVDADWIRVSGDGTARQWTNSVTILPHSKQTEELVVEAGCSDRRKTATRMSRPEVKPAAIQNDFGNKLMGHSAPLSPAIWRSYQEWFSRMPQVSGNDRFAQWYAQGIKDLRMLQSDLGYGKMAVAGVPWYAVPFGRDSLIASRQMLLAERDVARGTLLTMAHFQGWEERSERDEQPGKIVHEVRNGELSRLGTLPFSQYYGSIDATPLFLLLIADYFKWTGDEEFVRGLLSHVERALTWMTRFGDRDHDGFLEYWREASDGIANQGWKDSGDSIMYSDGRLVEGTVALCEVQAYAHRAYMEWHDIYTAFGMVHEADNLKHHAKTLQANFLQHFVLADGTVALALDGEKRPCQVISSNMGQVLVSDILPPGVARTVAQHMVSPDMLTGFGIRTLSSQEIRYNPVSYHNGSVWPHDTSLIIYGLRRHGYVAESLEVIENLLRAQDAFEYHRLPELFAGFSAVEISRPVPYPVSCSPQAWAAAVPVFVLEQCLGLQPDGVHRVIQIDPMLPDSVPYLEIRGIRLGGGILSVSLRRDKGGVDMKIIENSSGWPLVHPMAKEVRS
ncbi:MAG: amylo-alpha-1,6-glucosidase [Sulfobacillus benefaciens]|uniref:Amylo-alpha-1,6-glucosidase n=1 Tax=Sulfobacillus benefaciens TaxID=453960 RepID=A0A2T2XLT4_9FIRM|nr:MAG: amylo-alpha-1,6-glucosidase [Sulfobacillus benefaciens]